MKAKALIPLTLAMAGLATAQNLSSKKPAADSSPAKEADVAVDISSSAEDFPLVPPASPRPGTETPADKAPVTEEKKSEPLVEAPEPAEAPEGVTIQVEPGSSSGAVEASKVKLLAPFPAKALSKLPAGWRLEQPDNVPPVVREVSLANGTRISLSIRPHVLVPDADGSRVVGIGEPGYEANLQYAQEKTMGAILSGSLERMDKDAKDLGDAMERLEQLLGSLPHPAPAAPAAKPTSPSR